jgi:hypothetical protein
MVRAALLSTNRELWSDWMRCDPNGEAVTGLALTSERSIPFDGRPLGTIAAAGSSRTGGGEMVEVLTGVGVTALTEGVKFLYQQAEEVLTAWRARRRSADAQPPRALVAPPALSVGEARPVADAPDADAIDVLRALRDVVEPIRDGTIDVSSGAARQAIADLREFLEAALRASVTFSGEPPRPVRVQDVHVVAGRVAGTVTGLRVDLAKPRHGVDIGAVRVSTGDVAGAGEVMGVDLT